MQTTALPPDQQAEAIALYADLLALQIRHASDLADLAHAHATSMPNDRSPEILAQSTATHERAVRTMRRTIALATRLAAGALSQPAKPAADRAAARRRIQREAEDAIERHARTNPSTDKHALTAELYERLDAPDWDEDLDDRPLEDLIEDLCRDLGVARQGKNHVARRRTPADIQALNARANTVPNPPAATNHPHPALRPWPTTPPSPESHHPNTPKTQAPRPPPLKRTG